MKRAAQLRWGIPADLAVLSLPMHQLTGLDPWHDHRRSTAVPGFDDVDQNHFFSTRLNARACYSRSIEDAML